MRRRRAKRCLREVTSTSRSVLKWMASSPSVSTLAGDDADVGAAVDHAARDQSVRFFLKVDVDLRMGCQEARQDLGQEIADRGGVGEHAQVAAQAAAVFAQFAAHLLGLGKHQARVVQHRFARRQQAHAARFSRQQRHLGIASSALTRALAAASDRCWRSAARVRLPSSATATNKRRSV